MGSLDQHLTRAREILSEVPLIDGHNDFPFFIRGWHLGRAGDPKVVDARHMPAAHTDLNRLRKGCVGGVFWSAFVPCPDANKTNGFSTEAHYESLRATMQEIDIIYTLLERYPDDLRLARTSAEVWDAFKSGRVASLIGVEGLHQIANSASVLRNFYRLGVRYVTLTHGENNLYADSATSSSPIHGGLSKDGVEMVREMNRIGMIVDLSHTSVEVQKQALSLSRAPVIFSHSSCSAVTKHARNSPDEVLDMLKVNGGVFMISFLCKLTDADEATLERVADHVQHVGQRIGYEHVGIGSDFDGMMTTPSGLENVSKFPSLIAELLRRGVSEQSIRQLLGLNVLRVLDAVGEVSTQMKSENEEMLHDVFAPIWDDKLRSEIRQVRGIVEED
ncbi:Dipeptidase verJ [Cladobotryum mycophilum]|uniref:Dipeptidase n=1 Tax=Cladobotryum mycophilum TaxID=491253 RepID=A0ABR0S7K9_9HYPO